MNDGVRMITLIFSHAVAAMIGMVIGWLIPNNKWNG